MPMKKLIHEKHAFVATKRAKASKLLDVKEIKNEAFV